jgi:hypothetical protein
MAFGRLIFGTAEAVPFRYIGFLGADEAEAGSILGCWVLVTRIRALL